MRNIKFIIEYDGTLFQGWQIQSKNSRTVQGEIEKALAKILKQKIRLIGAGRTDSGVHAKGQVANFHTSSVMTTDELARALNANLPDDIVIRSAQNVPKNFHAQHNAKSKVYRYTICNGTTPCAIERFYCYSHRQPLDIALLKKESKVLIGKKDFKSFQASDPARKERAEDTIRTVKKLTVTQKGDFIFIDIEANGFLYKMVRNIVGALLEIATGHLSAGGMKKILLSRNRKIAPKTAPAKGLCLLKVKY